MPVVERVWEWHFAASPEALWPFIADTARIGEASGFPRYTVTDITQADGSVAHIGSARRLGMTMDWEEGVPEWVVNRRYRHERRFKSRLVRRLVTNIELDPEVRKSGDGGKPVVLEGENSPHAKSIFAFARKVAARVGEIKAGESTSVIQIQ